MSSNIPPPDFAVSKGDYKLADAIDILRRKWREGKQISVLVGAGISIQSGFPSLGPLSMYLLTLRALLKKVNYFPKRDGSNWECASAFNYRKMGWSSPCLFFELYGARPRDLITSSVENRYEEFFKDASGWNQGIWEEKWRRIKDETIASRTIEETARFASEVLGLSWHKVLEEIADHDPMLVDDLFDSIGSRVVPGAAHNLLAQFVSWMNVRLVMTPNFDSLIERSLSAEGLSPYVYDVHTDAKLPATELIRKHLAVLKLHGSHYGIRADATIDTPMDAGQEQTMLDYFHPEGVLLIMDYSGNDRRLMNVLKKLVEKKSEFSIIRVDALATTKWNKFFGLADKHKKQVTNLYYPHSRFFLLDVLQKCSGKMPNTRSGYPVVLQTPVPHKMEDMFGCQPKYESPDTKPADRPHAIVAKKIADIFGGVDSNVPDHRFAVVTAKSGRGTSQVLSQIAERLYKSHQLLWCDLDEAVSVGTLVAWIHRFLRSRQPELPDVPMPLELPRFEYEDQSFHPESLARTAAALWDRLKRDRYYVVVDSVSYALADMCGKKKSVIETEIIDERRKKEAKRLILFLAMLSWCASRSDKSGLCVLAIGTHTPETKVNSSREVNAEEVVTELRKIFDNLEPSEFSDSLKILPGQPELSDIQRLIKMILVPNIVSYENGDLNKNKLQEIGIADSECTDCGDDSCYYSDSVANDSSADFRSLFAWIKPSTEATEFYGWESNRMPAKEFIDSLRGKTEDVTSKETELSIPADSFKFFLQEAALSNRPLAWAQLLALPSVTSCWQPDTNEQFLTKATELNIDAGTLALRTLVTESINVQALRRQQGAYYYMDGSLRNELRLEFSIRTSEDRKPLIDAHKKMLRFYERAYNVSGDITALNHFCYHTWRVLEYSVDVEEKIADLQQMGRCLLENSRAARGHLNAYDHAFLLLNLKDALDLLKTNHKNDSVIRGVENKVLDALSELYESAEDFSGGFAVFNAKKVQPAKFALTHYHELQKILRRDLDLYRSCIAGVCALACDAGVPISSILSSISLTKSGIKQTINPSDVSSELFKILNVLTHSDTSDAWGKALRQNDKRRGVVHRVLLRLVRTLTRLIRFDPAFSKDQFGRTAEELLKFGISLQAMAGDNDTRNAKRLWTRYRCTHAFLDLYLLDENDYKLQTISRILVKSGLAKSYAVRDGGARGEMYEAIADIHEAEALLWEGKMLAKMQKWEPALARLGAVQDTLAGAQKVLGNTRLSLVWWREMPIFLCSAAADYVRCLFAQTVTDFEAKEEEEKKKKGDWTTGMSVETLEKAVSELEKASVNAYFYRPVVWNDAWRETRLAYQIFRIVFYARGIIAMAADKVETSSSDADKLVIVINRVLRVLRLSSDGDDSIILLPLDERDDLMKMDEWERKDKNEKTHRDLVRGISLAWETVHERIERAATRESLNNSGLKENSTDPMKTKAAELYKLLRETDDLNWNDEIKTKWKAAFMDHPNNMQTII